MFFGAANDEEGTTKYFLSQNKTYSRYTSLTGSTSSATFTQVVDKDFDVKFNRPQNIKGIVRVVFSMGVNTAAAQEKEIRVIAKLRKFDGTTETELGSAQTEDYGIVAGDPSGAPKSITANMEIDVSYRVIHLTSV